MSLENASFTQWVFTCRCEQIDIDAHQSPMCMSCGKFLVEESQTGGFTQWVFQSQTCSCENPVAIQVNSTNSSAAQIRFAETDVSDLNDSNFPIDRYKPESKLGVGGTGLVFLCQDQHLKKKVAVKILRTTMKDQFAEFQSEAKVTAKLSHKNMVKIIDFGITKSGSPFMVLEYVDGITLSALIAEEGPVAEETAVELFIQMATALGVGHENGIFHRDIKSSNVIITKFSHGLLVPHIIDFGIAVVAGQDLGQGKQLLGTPKYMSADQLLGRPFDARSEIYSLGCVMFETLTGRVPFEGADALTILDKHMEELPPSFADICPDIQISRRVEAIVLKCLEKDPNDRFQSMQELSVRLIRFAEDTGSIPHMMALKEEAAAKHIAVVGNLFDLSSTPVDKANVISNPDAEGRNLRGQVSVALVILIGIVVFTLPLFLQTEKQAKPAKVMRVDDLLQAQSDSSATDSLIKRDLQTDPNREEAIYDNSDLSETGVKYIAKMHRLKSLSLNGSTVKNDWLKHFEALKRLKELQLSDTEITDEGLVHIAKIKSLTRLDLEDTKVGDAGMEMLQPLERLSDLRLTATRVSDDGLKYLKAFPSLTILHIQSTLVTDKGLDYLTGLRNLIFLRIGASKVTGANLNKLVGLKHLEGLHLQSCSIKDEDLETVGRMTALKTLNLADNPLNGSGLYHLKALKLLRYLCLDGCHNISARYLIDFKTARPDCDLANSRGRVSGY